jgi:hypothetical protein
MPVIGPELLDLLRSVRDDIAGLGAEFGHVNARTTAIEQRLADVEMVLLRSRARGTLEDAQQLFARLKAEMTATKDQQGERLLSALPPRDREIVERLMMDYPTLSAAKAIDGLNMVRGL